MMEHAKSAEKANYRGAASSDRRITRRTAAIEREEPPKNGGSTLWMKRAKIK